MKVALHICCGVCAAGAAEKLVAEGHSVYGFFYNPNIHPQEEYEHRLAAARQVAKEFGFTIEEGSYQPQGWFSEIKGLEKEPEGGARCEVCFRHRLEQARRYMLGAGLDAFTTTLTIGPRKSAEMINRLGLEIGGDKFLVRDFKKKAGFQRATQMAKEWDIHRQHYCGCVYSPGDRQDLQQNRT